ncbi:hypothetical protein V7659_29995 [Neobacillus drentensis]|uniref:hypothetical protein n=1 Tax=Neobacillus drentensis TaxID=220684 RepID=UPI002FFE9AEB
MATAIPFFIALTGQSSLRIIGIKVIFFCLNGRYKFANKKVILCKLEKREGTINEIVYEFTSYRNGKYSIYPTISDLYLLLNKIICSKVTTEYIRITPFYLNEKVKLQREFDEYMFYLECREQFTVQDEEFHILENLGRDVNTVTSDEFETGKILTPLCRYNEPKTYKSLLEGYRKF